MKDYLAVRRLLLVGPDRGALLLAKSRPKNRTVRSKALIKVADAIIDRHLARLAKEAKDAKSKP